MYPRGRAKPRRQEKKRRSRPIEGTRAGSVTLLRAVSDGKRRSLAEAMRFVGADECWLATHYMQTTERLACAKQPTKLLLETLRECAKNLEGGGRNGQSGEPETFEIVHCVSRPELFGGGTEPARTASDHTGVAEAANS